MKTITIDIFNEKVLNLLRDLELLKLIRVRKHDLADKPSTDWTKFKGAMSKQSINSINEQLNKLRAEWD